MFNTKGTIPLNDPLENKENDQIQEILVKNFLKKEILFLTRDDFSR